MRIPVFVSCPTQLTPGQEEARSLILSEMENLKLEAKSIGRSDYPIECPLREVQCLASHCAGGIILGFEQYWAEEVVQWRGSDREQRLKNIALVTPWNHLEAGLLFGLGLPLLVFREAGVSGGIFDRGTTDVFVHTMPSRNGSKQEREALREVILKWQAKVQDCYYRRK